MDCYLLTLYVSLEQELSIRELFAYNGWHFNKYEDSSFNYDSKEDTDTCMPKKAAQDAADTSPTKLLIGENSSMKNVDLDTSANSEIFSDLQHFVEATLIAVGVDNSKTECGRNESEARSSTNSEICCVKQSCTPGDVKSTISVLTDTSEGIDGQETGIGVPIDDMTTTTRTLNKVCESSAANGHHLVAVSEKTSDSEMVDGSVSATSSEKSFTETSDDIVDVNPTLSVTNKSITCSKLDGNRVLNSSADDFTLHSITETNQSHESVPKGVFKVNDELKVVDDNNESKEKPEAMKNVSKKRNASKEKKKLKKVKVENTENNNIIEPKKSNRRMSKVGVFHCKECNNTFRLLGAYKNHKRDGKCRFECEHCGKIFTARYYSNFKSHLKYHLKERPHKCDICGKAYIEAQTLKIHLRKHSGDRPYICHHCGLQFYSSSHLLSHRNSAHSDARQIHKCDKCDATLSTLGNLRVHKKVVHAVERPFTCEICGKSFKTQKSLEQVHAKVHSEDCPYKCDFPECGKVFKRTEGLADHVRRHNNERNHFCERCGKGFYTNKDLMLHMRTHTGEKPHQCHLCDYKCALGGNLRKHLKTHQPPL